VRVKVVHATRLRQPNAIDEELGKGTFRHRVDPNAVTLG